MSPPTTDDGRAQVPMARPALARVGGAALAAAARDAGPGPVAFAIVAALAEDPPTRRAGLAVATEPDAPLRAVAVSGQSRIDPRRGPARRLLERLEAVRTSAPGEAPGGAGVGEDPTGRSVAVVLRDDRGAVAALLLERDPDRPFPHGTATRLEGACRDACLLLLARERQARARPLRLAARWATVEGSRLGAALARAVPGALRARLGPRGTALGLGAVAALGLGALPVPLVVEARATLEAEDRQVVSAPEAGHLVSAHARPGDRVERGALLARLDDREAALALDAARSDAHRVGEELARALATRDRQALATLRAEQRRLEAELAAAERRLERAEVRAPFAAVVLDGDPGRRLGAPVDAGEALFVLGSAERHRLVLEIDEHDVRLVRPDQLARVRMAGLPGRARVARLGDLLPVAVLELGRGAFRVPATFEDEARELRAGMRGVARVAVGRAPLALAWTRALRERATLLAWRVGLVR